MNAEFIFNNSYVGTTAARFDSQYMCIERIHSNSEHHITLDACIGIAHNLKPKKCVHQKSISGIFLAKFGFWNWIFGDLIKKKSKFNRKIRPFSEKMTVNLTLATEIKSAYPYRKNTNILIRITVKIGLVERIKYMKFPMSHATDEFVEKISSRSANRSSN